MKMGVVSFVYSIFDGPGVAFDFSSLRRDVVKTCDGIRKKVRIHARAVAQAREGLPQADDPRVTAIELDIRNLHNREIEEKRRRAARKNRRNRAGLNTMAIDVSDAEMKRIKSGLLARLAEVLTNMAGCLPGLARAKVQSESALAAYRAINSAHDVPTARSALEWFAATLAAAFAEALVNAHLFKGEMGYVDAVGFAMGVGGAIALIGVAGGIGWAQFRRPQLGRRIGGFALFGTALALVAFFVLGIAHYREALGGNSADAAAAAQVSMAVSPLAPLANTALLPYLILNLAGFALVCWKSISMWGYLDLKRLERACASNTRRFEQTKERGRGLCDLARKQALDLLDQTLRLAEAHVEKGYDMAAQAQEVREAFLSDANAIADAAVACEQEYREVVEMVHPQRGRLERFAKAPPRIVVTPMAPDDTETSALTALVTRLMKIRDAMPGMTDEIGTAVDEAIARIGALAAEAEEEARRNPRGRAENVLRFGK